MGGILLDFCGFISIYSTQYCRQMTLPIILLQQKAYRWYPQVSAWKTADLRGTSCLINSSHKWECFPCSDWYTTICLPCQQGYSPLHIRSHSVSEISGTTCSNTGLVCDLSVRTVSLFMWQYLNPLQPEFRPLRHAYRNGSNDIKGEPGEKRAGWRAHEGTTWHHCIEMHEKCSKM